MKIIAIAAITAALAACGTGEARSVALPARNKAEAAPAKPGPEPRERRVEEKDDLLEFTYAWPASAAAIPKLDARLEAEMKRTQAEVRSAAAEDQAGRTEDMAFNGHHFSKDWQDYGGGRGRLLSLAGAIQTFSGGAHGNLAYDAILWDRNADRAIGFADLFGDPAAAMKALTPAYCAALDKERSIRREEPLPLEGDDWSTGCPAIGDQVVAPQDGNSDGRFDRLAILIPPYEAGAYAEGAYPIEIPVTPAIRALVKPDYSGSF